MNKFFLSFVFLTIGIPTHAQEPVREQPYPHPQNIAQEIANIVVAKGKTIRGNELSEDSFSESCLRVYNDNGRFYEVCFGNYDNGRKTLGIDFYLTTRSLASITPSDIIVEELIFGRPKIHQELHMYDTEVDGTADIYQMFHKFNGILWDGFTREERDMGDKAGVKQFLYMGGKVFNKKRFRRDRWEKVSEEDKLQIQSSYTEHLNYLKELLIK